MSFRDRLYTPAVARAMTSPLAIIAAGAGASVGIIAGGGMPGSVVVGVLGAVAGWGARVAAAFKQSRGVGRIEYETLGDPWGRYARDALFASRSFRRTLERVKSGPIKDRLKDVAKRLDEAAEDVWAVAQAGHEMQLARKHIDLRGAKNDLRRVQGDKSIDELSPTAQATVRSLEAQVASAERLDALLASAKERLILFTARLDETVATSVELSVGASRAEDLQAVDDSVIAIVDELVALRSALAETSVDVPAGESLLAGSAGAAATSPMPDETRRGAAG